MRTRYTVLAFSDDGHSALVRSDVQGPEGGGEIGYELWSSAAMPHRLRVVVSSDFSQGGAEHPQTISTTACGAALKTLGDGLQKRGFREVSVHADHCGKRVDLVTVGGRHDKDVAESRFLARGNKLVRDGIEVRFRGREIGLWKDEVKQCAFAQPSRETPAEIAVAGTKGSRLIYVVETTSAGDQGLVGLCALGADGKLAPVGLETK